MGSIPSLEGRGALLTISTPHILDEFLPHDLFCKQYNNLARGTIFEKNFGHVFACGFGGVV